MTPTEKEKIKAILLDHITAVQIKIADLEEITKPIAPDKGLGRLTRLEAMNDKCVNEAALEQARQTLTRLSAASRRLHQLDFGMCLECRRPIAWERMEALPQSTLCVTCAT